MIGAYFRWLAPIVSVVSWAALLIGTAAVRADLPPRIELLYGFVGSRYSSSPVFAEVAPDQLQALFLSVGIALVVLATTGSVLWGRFPEAGGLVSGLSGVFSVWLTALMGLSLQATLGHVRAEYYYPALLAAAVFVVLFLLLVALPALPGVISTHRWSELRERVLRTRRATRRAEGRAKRKALRDG